MADSSANGGCSLSIPFVLFLVFLILKLCGVIAWSWWWVTAPLWIAALTVLGILVGMIVTILCVSGPGILVATLRK